MPDTSARAIATWIRHEEALVSLRLALSILDGVGVPAVVVKGMVLAYELYDDVAERPMSDVDLRVKPGDLFRAFRALRARGYAPDWTSKQLGAVAFKLGHTLVELEASVGPPGLCALTVRQLLARSRRRVLPGGLIVSEPEPCDHAILLIVNAFKDKFVNCPRWSLDDLDAMMHRIDRETFLARVADCRLATVTWITADWMARERGGETWLMIREALDSFPVRRGYALAMRYLARRHQASLAARVLARVGSDSVARQAWAAGAAAIGIAASEIARRSSQAAS